jgi:hypothetical protein
VAHHKRPGHRFVGQKSPAACYFPRDLFFCFFTFKLTMGAFTPVPRETGLETRCFFDFPATRILLQATDDGTLQAIGKQSWSARPVLLFRRVTRLLEHLEPDRAHDSVISRDDDLTVAVGFKATARPPLPAYARPCLGDLRGGGALSSRPRHAHADRRLGAPESLRRDPRVAVR